MAALSVHESPVNRQKLIRRVIGGRGTGSHKDCPPAGTADAETSPRRHPGTIVAQR